MVFGEVTVRENEEKTRKVGGTEKFSRLTFTRLTVSLVREVSKRTTHPH